MNEGHSVNCADAIATIVENVMRERDRIELKEFKELIAGLVARVDALEKLRGF